VAFPHLIAINVALFDRDEHDRWVLRCGREQPRLSNEVLMRMSCWLVLAVATMILPALPAAAQRYDPNYPVCMQVWTRDGNTINCSFTSWDQCRAVASGFSAMCLDNPYWPQAPQGSPHHRRRHRTY
jgi:hypothetical protein